MKKIDFVVTWVNGEDLNWQKKKIFYSSTDTDKNNLNTISRYRDFGIFKYWFRSIEKFAPWVNSVFLITDQQIPSWLDINNSKLKIIDHTDYIDSKYLPTFNSNVIELNINKIPELSDCFVLFNDDMFLNSFVSPQDFFENNIPKDLFIESPIIATKGSIAHTLVNDMEIINDYFDKKSFYKTNALKIFNFKIGTKLLRTLALIPSKNFSGIWNSHLPVAYNKTTFDEVWKHYGKELETTSNHKFRTAYDYSHWLMRYWQLVSGDYVLQKKNFGKVYELSTKSIDKVTTEIISSKHKVVCLNDNDSLDNFIRIKESLNNVFEKKFNLKSGFER